MQYSILIFPAHTQHKLMHKCAFYLCMHNHIIYCMYHNTKTRWYWCWSHGDNFINYFLLWYYSYYYIIISLFLVSKMRDRLAVLLGKTQRRQIVWDVLLCGTEILHEWHWIAFLELEKSLNKVPLKSRRNQLLIKDTI